MKNRKKWISVICSIVMVAGLAACGAKDPGTEDKGKETDGEKEKFPSNGQKK